MIEGQVGEAITQEPDRPAPMTELRGSKYIGSINLVNNNGWVPKNIQSGETHELSDV